MRACARVHTHTHTYMHTHTDTQTHAHTHTHTRTRTHTHIHAHTCICVVILILENFELVATKYDTCPEPANITDSSRCYTIVGMQPGTQQQANDSIVDCEVSS